MLCLLCHTLEVSISEFDMGIFVAKVCTLRASGVSLKYPLCSSCAFSFGVNITLS